MSRARANARMSLMLAIGELQKSAGPDMRITAPANLMHTTAAPGITGVWKSWRPPNSSPDYNSAKAGDNFLGYLMSNPSPAAKPDPKSLPTTTGNVQQLVGSGTAGTANKNNEISAPTVEIMGSKTQATGRLAWVTLDEGVKGRIDLAPAKVATGSGEKITQAGSPERNGFEDVKDFEFLIGNSTGARDKLRDVLPKLISLNQSSLFGNKASAVIQPYFHDFTVDSASVQSDAANGGLKTDLSVLFDGTSLPSDYASRRLYSNTSSPLGSGNGPDPLWSIYHQYSRLYKKVTPNDNPVDGMKAYVNPLYKLASYSEPAPSPGPRIEPDMASLKEPMIMPTVSRVDIVFSLVARDAHGGRAAALIAKGYPYLMHLMYLPVITLHNPFNVPLRFTELEIEFSDLPMGFQFLVGGQPATTRIMGLNQLYWGNESGANQKVFKLTLTGDLTSSKEVIMGAGETRIFGKPFPSAWRWSDEQAGAGADGVMMFDWRSDKTGAGSRIMPGMITGPNDGVGYDVDWLAPRIAKSSWVNSRTDEGILPVKPTESISVLYGPLSQASSPDKKFSVTLRLKNSGVSTDIATTRIFFKDDARLKAILEEGTSPRFKTVRNFPETYPKIPFDSPKTAANLYESNTNPVSKYAQARPFAIFSLSGKTTKESFTASRPVADTGAAYQMATCDFTSSASQGASPLEFMLTPVRGGSAVIESDGVKGYFFGGFGTNNGTSSSTLYEIPMAPLQSIAQLRHANAASLGSVPYVTYSVGESRAHPAIPAEMSFYTPATGKVCYDHSWLANDQLWDRYWFSTLASLEGQMYTGASAMQMQALASAFFNGSRLLPNMRNAAYMPPGKTAGEAASAAIDSNGRRSAAYMLTTGGFNVNSTSVAAWTSILSGLCDTDVPLATGSGEGMASGAPFLRIRRPVLGQSGGGSSKEKLWNSYRSLKSSEINELARKIVDEVRARGPFLSMSEFVNRRLGASGDLTNKGALQAALDKTGFNDVMLANADVIVPGDVGAFGWKNPGAVSGNTGAGAPGEISQGDILSSIGPFTGVRSDTFKIRAYGDTRDANGVVVARAWCEAIVQRLPGYVDGADAPEVSPTASANINFGRQFKIVGFRWLNPGEI